MLTTWTYTSLGQVALYQGAYARANAAGQAALALFQQLGGKGEMALMILGQVALAQGDSAQAYMLQEESVRLFRAVARQGALARALPQLSAAVHAQGDDARAAALLCEALMLQQQQGNAHRIAESLEGFARLAVAQRGATRAAQLWGAAAALRAISGAPLPPADCVAYDQATATLRAQLDEATFAAAWATGRSLTLEQAIAYALEGSEMGSVPSTGTAASSQ